MISAFTPLAWKQKYFFLQLLFVLIAFWDKLCSGLVSYGNEETQDKHYFQLLMCKNGNLIGKQRDHTNCYQSIFCIGESLSLC